MAIMISKAVRSAAKMAVCGMVAAVVAASSVSAQEQFFDNKKKSTNERYAPTIWVDPDGCEHWVMDDGFEGYMTPHTNRQGIPVCRRGNVCGVMDSDQFFATNSAKISGAGKSRLQQFFRETGAVSYIITGHTDSRASDSYNMDLSMRRATAVAKVAQSAGARIADVRGYGERLPRASNASAGGMAKNRRVEIICIR
ncbi:hypothetical protein NBRC116596_09390 [Litorivita sp. NS0012-18]